MTGYPTVVGGAALVNVGYGDDDVHVDVHDVDGDESRAAVLPRVPLFVEEYDSIGCGIAALQSSGLNCIAPTDCGEIVNCVLCDGVARARSALTVKLLPIFVIYSILHSLPYKHDR